MKQSKRHSDSFKLRNPKIAGLSGRLGFTLIELLIATTITLVILLTMLRAFVVANKEIKKGRNRVVTAERIQATADLIRDDLGKLSVPIRTDGNELAGNGYFMYVDGPLRDQTRLLTGGSGFQNNSVLGDLDDVLMFTAVSKGLPFRGRFNNQIIESHAAEIIYWTELVRDENGNGQVDYGDQVMLYRRVLLIRPDLSPEALSDAMLIHNGTFTHNPTGNAASYLANFYYNNDVSISSHSVVNAGPPINSGTTSGKRYFNVRANSLKSLSLLENRTCHFSWDYRRRTNRPFPYILYRTQPGRVAAQSYGDGFSPTFPSLDNNVIGVNYPTPSQVGREVPVTLSDLQYSAGSVGGQTQLVRVKGLVALENALAFDVRVFDPNVPVFTSKNSQGSIKPSDPGYLKGFQAGSGLTIGGFGAYIDLGCFHFMEFGANDVSGVHSSRDFAASFFPAFSGSYDYRHPEFAFVEPEDHLVYRMMGSTDRTRYLKKVGEDSIDKYLTRPGTGSNAQIMGPTYTTLPGLHYEKNRIDENGNGLVDDGTDGLPEFGVPSGGVPSSYLDRDVIPPYSGPIRSIQITIRAGSLNPDTQVISASDQVLQRKIEIATDR